MTNYDKLIAAYEVDVRFPDVSGMEHLDMLITRSEIAKGERCLTDEQRDRLAEVDRVLLQQSPCFYRAIQKIADLDIWRVTKVCPLRIGGGILMFWPSCLSYPCRNRSWQHLQLDSI